MIKPEEAVLLFLKWERESTLLRVVLWLRLGHVSVDCRVEEFRGGDFFIKLRSDGVLLEFCLSGCIFEYGEPRSGEEEGMTAALLALSSLDERLIFMELKSTQ